MTVPGQLTKETFLFFERKRWLPSAQRWDWNSLFSPKTAGRQMTSRGQGDSEMELDGVSSRFGGRAQMEHTTRVTRVELWSAIKHYPPCREHYWSEWQTSRAQIFPFVQSSIMCWISQNLTQPSQRGDRAPIRWEPDFAASWHRVTGNLQRATQSWTRVKKRKLAPEWIGVWTSMLAARRPNWQLKEHAFLASTASKIKSNSFL